uniref:C-type lectin domain-containing protein n=1 Tax=Panagrolaimus superbus TaxID=310955 RepID=A0A914YC54_9BILA
MSWLLFFAIFSSLSSSILGICPKGTVASISDNTTCYLFQSQKQKFLAAEKLCTQHGGHLTSIHNAFESVFINEKAQKNFTDSSMNHFWVGLNDLVKSNNWVWTDGSAVDFVEWDYKQPEETFKCTASSLQTGLWHSANCDEGKPFICKIPKCLDAWKYFDETKSCYKVFKNMNWQNAENACVAEGAHLTSIHSQDENNFVAKLIPFNQDTFHCTDQNYAWIGLYTVDKQNTWQWIDNSTYNFSAWAVGEPYRHNENFCGVILDQPICGARLGSWGSGYCPADDVGFYVCKKMSAF